MDFYSAAGLQVYCNRHPDQNLIKRSPEARFVLCDIHSCRCMALLVPNLNSSCITLPGTTEALQVATVG